MNKLKDFLKDFDCSTIPLTLSAPFFMLSFSEPFRFDFLAIALVLVIFFILIRRR